MGLFDFLFKDKNQDVSPVRPGAPNRPPDLPPVDVIVQQLREKYDLPASLMLAAPSYRPEDPKASWLGRVVVGRPDEAWPSYQGQPMVGICQINLTEAPHVPDALKDLRLITVFMAAGDKEWPIDFPLEEDSPGTRWVLRAYDALDELIPYPDAPAPPRTIKPCAVRYKLISDHHPNSYEFEEVVEWRRQYPEKIVERITEAYDNQPGEAEEAYGSKVGGWPAPIQDPITRPIAFQLGCEEKVGLQWIDGGCVYFWRNRSDQENEWNLELQFY